MNARTHILPTGTISRTAMTEAMLAAQATSNVFEFDLLDAIKTLKSPEFAKRLMSRWAFACDAWIGGAINSALNEFRLAKEDSGNADWDNWQDFVSYIEGIAPREQAMIDMGLDTTVLAEKVQRLYSMRRAIHSSIAALSAGGGTTYEEPSIIEFFLEPKQRKDDVETQMKREAGSKEYATDDDGVIDVERMQHHAAVSAKKAALKRKSDLEFDRLRGKMAAALFETLIGSTYGPDAEDPFGDLSKIDQLKSISGMQRYVDGVMQQAEDDRTISASEHTNWAFEARPLRKLLKAALAHPVLVEAAVKLAERQH